MKKDEEYKTNEKSKSLENKIMESHKQFLEAIKDTYYLAVLSSLSLAIAAFTKDTLVGASTYAIVSASLFLCAFLCSFVVKLAPNAPYVIGSYISMVVGIIFLVLVIFEFAQVVPLVFKWIFPIFYAMGIIILVQMINYYRKIAKKSEYKIPRFLGSITFFLGVSTIPILTTIFVGYYLSEYLKYPLDFYPAAFVVIALIFLIIALIVFLAFPIFGLLTVIVHIFIKKKERTSRRCNNVRKSHSRTKKN